MKTKEKRILVVGNQDCTGELIVAILKKEGYSDVLLARDNQGGIDEIVGGYCPDLVIVTALREDGSGAGGEEAIKLVKAVSREIKVIALSGDGDAAAAEAAVSVAGADMFLAKPFKLKVFMLAVKTLLV